ncbi:MAG: STAS/SEC14 domain-containing protein [Methylococcaceae bacterium]|nr:STAS/SEC14 domain-containing protein [Methylococcaceae bacterium]
MIEQLQTDSQKILAFKLSGKLHDADYSTFVPAVDAAVAAEGEIRLFVQFEEGFQGWNLHAAWDDVKFAASHYSDFYRIAMVGDRKWEEWMAKIGRPFTSASIGYFDVSDVDVAWAWLREGL